MRVLVTGGAGFIGSALVRYLVSEIGADVLTVDKLTYAGNLASLKPIENAPNHRFLQVDICDRVAMNDAFATFQPDYVMHLAAESHVDRSITGAADFIQTNINGTFTMLEAARQYWSGLADDAKANFRMLHVSTDEVYGSLGDDGLSKKQPLTTLHRHTPPRKPRAIISPQPGSARTAFRSSFPTAPTITGHSISRKSSFR